MDKRFNQGWKENSQNLRAKNLAIQILALTAIILILDIHFIIGSRIANLTLEVQTYKAKERIQAELIMKKLENPSQSTTTPESEQDAIISTMKTVCKLKGIDGDICWKTLYGMAYQESSMGNAMMGDGGRSQGWYHIQTKLHDVQESCAKDLFCSSWWTLNNLVNNDFLSDWEYAVQSHNGIVTPDRSKWTYAKRIKQLISEKKYETQ